MNPWVLQHLRLAEVRGSLRAPNSRVQDAALTILRMLAETEKSRHRLDMVKGLAVQPMADLERIKDAFPEFFDDPFHEAYGEDGDLDPDRVDDSKIEWATPATPEEDEAVSAWIARHESGTISAADLDT